MLTHSISTKPYFDTELADILLEAGRDIVRINRLSSVTAHDIVMAMDYSVAGKKSLLML